MRLLSNLLKRFVQVGTLTVVDHRGKRHVFAGAPGPVVTFHLHDPAVANKLFWNPDLGLGEAYMDGALTFEDCTLRDFLHLFNLNRRSLGTHPLQAVLQSISRRVRKLQQYNPVGRARDHVAHHYDLSRQLYELFLDKDMQYSCAYFASEGDSLETAQLNKKRHIAAKLCLEPGQRVLDIGCGWGGLALYLAQQADIEVVGVTLSTEQHKVAVERAKSLGLSDRVRFELRDYRELEGTFDRIVSVGMFEHVGAGHYEEFFTKINSLMDDAGVMLLHSIGRMSPPGITGPWLRKYIFPGGYSPALSEVFEVTQRQRLWVTDVEVLRLHYALTLREWQKRFQANRQKAAALYDERFCRMWEFYLTCAEMVFSHGSGMVFQMQLTRDRAAVPGTRGYMYQAPRAHSLAVLPESIAA
ncbi:MAG: class I SAM-dependent methyltransferase [Planctomycetaceae bacterium]|nr:class I SAM-dependent methyltransferase [Planctomycetaceae bacterium]